MAIIIQRISQNGNMAKPEQLLGLQTVAQTIGEQIQILSADKTQKERVRKYGDDLGQLMNEVRGFAQRLAQQMKEAQANGNGAPGVDPKDAAQITGIECQ